MLRPDYPRGTAVGSGTPSACGLWLCVEAGAERARADPLSGVGLTCGIDAMSNRIAYLQSILNADLNTTLPDIVHLQYQYDRGILQDVLPHLTIT